MKPANKESRYPVLAFIYAFGTPFALWGICYAIDVARGLS